MKSLFSFKLYAIAATIVLTAMPLLSSCGNDNDEPELTPSTPPTPPTPPATFESVTVSYIPELSWAYQAFYNMTAEYINEDGILESRQLTGQKGIECTIPVSKLPDKLTYTLKLTLKNPMEEDIDPDYVYIFHYNIKMAIVAHRTDGSVYETTESYFASSIPFRITCQGHELMHYLASRTSQVVGPVVYDTTDFRIK